MVPVVADVQLPAGPLRRRNSTPVDLDRNARDLTMDRQQPPFGLVPDPGVPVERAAGSAFVRFTSEATAGR